MDEINWITGMDTYKRLLEGAKRKSKSSILVQIILTMYRGGF